MVDVTDDGVVALTHQAVRMLNRLHVPLFFSRLHFQHSSWTLKFQFCQIPFGINVLEEIKSHPSGKGSINQLINMSPNALYNQREKDHEE